MLATTTRAITLTMSPARPYPGAAKPQRGIDRKHAPGQIGPGEPPKAEGDDDDGGHGDHDHTEGKRVACRRYNENSREQPFIVLQHRRLVAPMDDDKDKLPDDPNHRSKAQRVANPSNARAQAGPQRRRIEW